MSTVNDTAARDLGREDLQLVAEGDKRAFARLYDAWAPTLFALISCVLKDRAQAEEVLQDGLGDLDDVGVGFGALVGDFGKDAHMVLADDG